MDWGHLITWGGVISLVVAALVALYRLKPESSKIFVETAKVTVDLANDQRDDLKAQVEDLIKRVGSLETELATTKVDLAEAQAVAQRANKRADRMAQQLTVEKSKVRYLQQEVGALRDILDEHHITPPEVAEDKE